MAWKGEKWKVYIYIIVFVVNWVNMERLKFQHKNNGMIQTLLEWLTEMYFELFSEVMISTLDVFGSKLEH